MQDIITRKGQYYPVPSLFHSWVLFFCFFFLLVSDLLKDYLGGEGKNSVFIRWTHVS